MDENPNKPTILVTNDDGITAPGIAALVEAVRPLANIIVVAPDAPQSGMGHAITVASPLRLDKVDIFEGIESYQSSGTPADCVKLAVANLLHHKPHMVVSGINHGSNSSINVIYSGTMSAAVEAGLEGIPAIGFSLLNFSHQADMAAAGAVARQVIMQMLQNLDSFPSPLLNVNIPNLPHAQIKGIKVCRQAKAKWAEKFDERIDPHGRKYFWLTGKWVNHDLDDDTDEWALSNGFVSVVPVQYDLTAYNHIQTLKNVNLSL